jgi:hypothetical protein
MDTRYAVKIAGAKSAKSGVSGWLQPPKLDARGNQCRVMMLSDDGFLIFYGVANQIPNDKIPCVTVVNQLIQALVGTSQTIDDKQFVVSPG